MVINENNSHINSFTKGMNSDAAYDQIQNSQYTFGQNIRITKNQSLGGVTGDFSSLHEGIVAPVPAGISAGNTNIDGKILAVDSLDNICTIVATKDNSLDVYKITIENDSVKDSKPIWSIANFWNGDTPEQVSTVLYKELENVIKLYIATGKTPIVTIRVDDEGQKDSGNVDDYINNRIVPRSRVYIDKVISGRLRTSQVQYTYRYYNKYGNTTQLAPLTNKIQIIDPSRSKEVGNAEDTETSIGLSLNIDTTEYHGFDRMQVYRLSYIKPRESAEVALIYDDKIPSTDNKFVLNDIGIEPLQRLTMDEFAAMSGLILVPQVIEQNQEYMFCGNIKDDTIIKGLELKDYTFNPDTIQANIVLSEHSDGRIPQIPSNAPITDDTITTYLQERMVNKDAVQATYNNIFASSLLRSLRRGERYKYGIVYYDKYGRRSDVQKLGAIDIPEISDNATFYVDTDGKLIARPLGVQITLPQITGANPKDIIGCQVVRRSSSNVYQKTLLQVALARPLQQGLAEQQGNPDVTKQSPFYPSGFLTTNDFVIQYHHYWDLIDGNGRDYDDQLYQDLWARTKNTKLYQIFNSEINYHRDDIISELNVSTTKIKEVLYLYSDFIKYIAGSEEYNTFHGLYSATNVQASVDTSKTEVLCQINNVSGNELSPTLKAEFRRQTTIQSINSTTDYTQTVQDADVILISDDTGVSNLTYHLYQNDDSLIAECQSGGTVTQAIKDAFEDNNTNYISIFVDNIPNNTTIPSDRNIIIKCIKYNTENNTAPSTTVTAIDVIKVDKLNMSNKQDIYYVFNFFRSAGTSGFVDSEIKSIKDVKIPSWNSAFENVQFEDNTRIYDATKKYRGYTTAVGEFKYNNWISFGKYDFKPGTASYPNNSHTESGYVAEIIAPTSEYTRWLNANTQNIDYDSLPSYGKNQVELGLRNGYIGPGPSCFLLATEQPTEGFTVPNASKFYTSICNIYRDAVQDDVTSDEQEIYYGFGNYFELELDGTSGQLKTKSGKDTLTVFDGDIYITPHEFTTFYKAYDFNSVDTLQSIQVTNYVPLESKVNTYFDYGMNLLNTDSANLLFEPGAIDGVTSQERPAHQYNLIYSDNDTSNDVFTLISTDKNETNQFKQRAYYSELKTNGEFVDNFLIFKPAAFIDVDSKYGEITEMLTDKNQLYYWQDHAFGRFSVNERSLVNDQNGNTIMLGQAGILSRYDYASTKYGMRPQDFCARSTEQGIYWVDINNKAIVAGNSEQVVNYGEQLGVQNLINSRLTSDIPKVDYDLQNNELLCKCFGDDQLVFNIKYGMATSIYTRRYDWITYIKNHIFGIDGRQLIKFNYLNETENTKYLLPVELEFIVNHSASITKVFDNQQIIPIKRNQYLGDSFDKLQMAFETDLYSTDAKPELYTDREGNILYAIPRFDNQDYGSRLRGKWMKVKFTNDDESLSDNFTISHVITKFRQSFS